MNSSATPDGAFSITVTFRLGTDLDTAQVQTQNRVSQAATRLPLAVRQIGLVTQKSSPTSRWSCSSFRPTAATTRCTCATTPSFRCVTYLRGCRARATCVVFGSGDYAMRLWLDPGKIAARGLTVEDVLARCASRTPTSRPDESADSPRFPARSSRTSSTLADGCETEQEFGAIVIKTGAAGRRRVSARRRTHRARPRDVRTAQHAGRAQCGGHPDLSAARRERARVVGCRAADDGRAVEDLPAGRELRDSIRSDGVREKLDRRRRGDALRGRRCSWCW